MKVNTLISTCKKTLDPSVAEGPAREPNRHTSGSHPLNKVRDGRRKKAATPSGIGIALLSVLLSGPAAAGTVTVTNIGTTGPKSPGATYSSWWNNASTSRGYYIDVVPKGASQPFNTPCKFEVVRLVEQQVANQSIKEREVHFTIKNVGSITCSADILLVSFVP